MDNPQIVASEVPQNPNVNPSVGLANGAEITDANGQSTGERVVYEFNAQGEFVGWHKELING